MWISKTQGLVKFEPSHFRVIPWCRYFEPLGSMQYQVYPWLTPYIIGVLFSVHTLYALPMATPQSGRHG